MVGFLFRSFLQTDSYFHSYIHVGYKKLVGFSHLTVVLFFIGCRPLFTLNNVTLRTGNNLSCVYTLPESFCVDAGADPGFSLGGGALVSRSTSTPIIVFFFFFCRIPVV